MSLLVSLNPKIPTTLYNIHINHRATDVAVEKNENPQLSDRFRTNWSFRFSNLVEVHVSLSLAGHETWAFDKLKYSYNITEPHYGTYGSPSRSVRAINSLLPQHVIAANSCQPLPAFILL